jgi:pectinesterase
MKEYYIGPAGAGQKNELCFRTIVEALSHISDADKRAEGAFPVSGNRMPENEADGNHPSGQERNCGQVFTPVVIHIPAGVFTEHLEIRRPFLTLLGSTEGETVITGSLHAREILSDGKKRGTFRTQTVLVMTHDFTARNITFRNTAGFGEKAGQALSLYADGDRLTFDHCRFLGCQDTLFTGPLPPEEYETGGFRGPGEFLPRINGRQYYRNCFIRGEIDFIFGSATAYFENCELFSLKTDDLPAAENPADQKIYGYVTASSAPEGQKYGYVFEKCRLTGNCPPASCYLGRPWRDFAKAVYLNCEMGSHIHPAGWDDWKKENARKTVFFAEYRSEGPGGSSRKRAPFSRQLSEKEARDFTKEKILAGQDGWDPS